MLKDLKTMPTVAEVEAQLAELETTYRARKSTLKPLLAALKAEGEPKKDAKTKAPASPTEGDGKDGQA